MSEQNRQEILLHQLLDADPSVTQLGTAPECGYPYLKGGVNHASQTIEAGGRRYVITAVEVSR